MFCGMLKFFKFIKYVSIVVSKYSFEMPSDVWSPVVFTYT